MVEITDIRIIYKKLGKMKFVSHLDMNRFFPRMLRKTKLPIWYTEGFNKRVYVNFALPLSLGYESLYEVMDFRITQNTELSVIEEKLKEVLPESIVLIKAVYPKMKSKEIASAVYNIKFYDVNLTESIKKLLEQEQLLTLKKTKKGIKEIDLKPNILKYEVNKENGNTVLMLKLPAGNTLNINPSLITDIILKECADGSNNDICYSVTRTVLLNEKDEVFI